MNELFVKPDYIKLEQALKLCGIADTGGIAKELILDGEVLVNGEVCLMRGKKLQNGDIFSFQGEQYEIKFR